jgi:hypothetical protein
MKFLTLASAVSLVLSLNVFNFSPAQAGESIKIPEISAETICPPTEGEGQKRFFEKNPKAKSLQLWKYEDGCWDNIFYTTGFKNKSVEALYKEGVSELLTQIKEEPEPLQQIVEKDRNNDGKLDFFQFSYYLEDGYFSQSIALRVVIFDPQKGLGNENLGYKP